MGLKNKITSWVAGVAVDDVLKSRLGVVEKDKRTRVVREVKQLVNPKQKYVGYIGVAVALFAAFGLELDPEQLAITIATVIAIATFLQRKLTKKKDQG